MTKAYDKWDRGEVRPEQMGLQEAIQELLGGAVYKPQFNNDVKAFLKHSYGHSDLKFVLDRYRVDAYGDGIHAQIQGTPYLIDNPDYITQGKDGNLMFLKEVSPDHYMGVGLDMGLGRRGTHNKGAWGLLNRKGRKPIEGALKPTQKGYSQEQLAQFDEGRAWGCLFAPQFYLCVTLYFTKYPLSNAKHSHHVLKTA
ncbi:hypothetical protein [Helicobacter vulpis]|uniref:hypothetical protein n=1 Tax=Helicobacter vulpis TaxID=2316076 RepID=UPI000EAE5BE0|nr:hypothetical protein [Helicobacter vulpis]